MPKINIIISETKEGLLEMDSSTNEYPLHHQVEKIINFLKTYKTKRNDEDIETHNTNKSKESYRFTAKATKKSPSEFTIEQNKDNKEVIEAFREVNSSINSLFSRLSERKAAFDLINLEGKENILNIIKNIVPITNKQEFAPVITTPSALLRKLANLKLFIEKNPNLFSENIIKATPTIEDSSYDAETGIHYKNGSLQFSELNEEQQVKYLVDMAKRIEHNAEPIKEIEETEFKKDLKKKKSTPLQKKDITFINF
jgi:hypothetical protein